MKVVVTLLSSLLCLSFMIVSNQSLASMMNPSSAPVKKEVSKEKWEYYASDEEGADYSYNPGTLKRVKGDRVKVRVRAVYPEKNPKYSQSDLQWEIDCAKKSMRGLAGQAKKKDGTEEILTTSSDWSTIPAESTAEMLYETVCRKKDTKTP